MRPRDELDDLHATAVTIPCRYCGAGRGEPCRNRKSGTPTKIPHGHRLRQSQEVPF